MTLDDIIAAFELRTEAPEVNRLGGLIREWKADSTTVDELDARVERYISAVWGEGSLAPETALRTWKRFKSEVIDVVRGMTMNERLWVFGLSDRYGGVFASKAEKEVVQAKLLAYE